MLNIKNLNPFKDLIRSHLYFKKYHSIDWDITKFNWTRNPFTTNILSLEHLKSREQEELIELVSNSILKLIFQEKYFAKFWLSIHIEYQNLYEMGMYILLQFESTYYVKLDFQL